VKESETEKKRVAGAGRTARTCPFVFFFFNNKQVIIVLAGQPAG
jgi:hypothetical protein